MSSQTIGLLIGGIIPAIIYGISGIFSKSAMQIGMGLAPYLIITGAAIALTGLVFGMIQGDWHLSTRAGLHALALGMTWGVGTGLVAIGLSVYNVPLGKLAPLYNMNTLVAVLLALWIFSEWSRVSVPQLLIGSMLIVIGGTMVARA